MSGTGVISDDLAVATANMEESECLKDQSDSFRILTFCCVCCFQRRNENNCVQRKGKKKRNKRNEEEGHIGAMPLNKPDKEEQQRKGQDCWSTVSLGEQDHGDAVTLAAKPYSMEIQDSLSTVHLDVHHKEQKQEQKHLSPVLRKVHYEEQQRKDRQDYLNNLSLGARHERGKQRGQDHVSAMSEGATTNEEQDYQSVSHKQQPTGTEHLSILSLGVIYEKEKQGRQIHVSFQCEGAACKEEQDHHAIPYMEEQQPMGPEHTSNLSLDVTSEKKKQEQDHVSTESESAPSKEEQDSQGVPHKDEQQPMGPEHPNNLSLDITYEQEKQEGHHVSSKSQSAAYREEQDCQGVSDKEEQQPVGPELLSTWILGVTYEQEKEGEDYVSTQSEGAPSKEEQDCQCVSYKEEQQLMGSEHLSVLSLGVPDEEEKQDREHVSFESEGAAYKEKQDCQGVPDKEEQQPMGPEHPNNLSLDITYEQENQEGDHVSSKSEDAAYREEQDCQSVPDKEEQQPVGPEHWSTWFLGVAYEQEKQGEDNVSFQSEGAPFKEEQDCQGVPYKEEQQIMGSEHLSVSSLEVPYKQEKQEGDHLSFESEGAAYGEKQDCQGVPDKKEQQPVGPELLSTWFLGVTYNKEQQVGKDHVSSVSEGASCKEKQYYQGAPHSEQQQVKGPEQLSTLSLPVTSEEEQQIRPDHLNIRSVGALHEMDKQVGQTHQSNLFLFVPNDEGKQQEGQNDQNIMPLSVTCDSEKELWEGQDPQKILFLYVPREEEEQQEKQDLVNNMIPCMPCDKGKQQEGQNLMYTLYEKEMKEQDGGQDQLSPVSVCVAGKKNEKEEEEQDLLNTTA